MGTTGEGKAATRGIEGFHMTAISGQPNWTNSEIWSLDDRSRALRLKMIRVLEKCRRGHIGSALSILEILRVLYDKILRYDPKRPLWEDRDRFILSKGHGCIALYLLLAEKGFFPEEELDSISAFESRLGGHPKFGLPGVEAATGALGHGLSIGVGFSIAAKIDSKAYRTFVLVGDGECQEGSIWEAALSAGKYSLDNLTVIIDRNHMQCYGMTKEVQPLEPFADKLTSFGFAVRECHGHDVEAIHEHLKGVPFVAGMPSALICHTRKGMGFPSIVDDPAWHHKSRIKDEEIRQLLSDLEENR